MRNSPTISKCFDRVPVLISYAYIKSKSQVEIFESLLARDDITILIDCGAFTVFNSGGTIRLDDYCKFIDKYRDRLYGYMALDVVGNPKATDDNLQQMWANGYEPMPIHVIGDDEKRMDELFERSTCVAFGGVNRVRKTETARSFVDKYIKQKMAWAKGRDVHWLGVTRRKIIAAFRPASCDSCTWCNGQMYGQCGIYMGNGRWEMFYGSKHKYKLAADRQAMAIANDVIPGFSKDVLDDRSWRSSKNDFGHATTIQTDSWVRYAMDFYRMFGTRIFLALTPTTDIVAPLTRAIERNKHRLGK